jgi:hypothetical protein
MDRICSQAGSTNCAVSCRSSTCLLAVCGSPTRGYWRLLWLCSLVKQGVYFLLRDITGIVLWCTKPRLDLLAVLPQQEGQRLELVVDVGATKQVKGVRLLGSAGS